MLNDGFIGAWPVGAALRPLEEPLPDRDTVRLRGDAAEEDGEETTALGPPRRARRWDRRSTVIDLRGGRPRARQTEPDLGLTMATDLGDGGEREQDPAPARRSRRRLVLGAAAALAVPVALALSLLAAYGGDARGAVGGDCVYDAGEVALVPGGWRTQPCALPAFAGDRHQVLLRIEGTAEAAACAEHLTSWGAEGDREAVVGTDSRPAVLCLVPVN